MTSIKSTIAKVLCVAAPIAYLMVETAPRTFG